MTAQNRSNSAQLLGAKRKAAPLFPTSLRENRVFSGDCLDVLRALNGEHDGGFIDLIYIDPPFNSKRVYNRFFEDENGEKAQEIAFRDTWARVDYRRELEWIAVKNADLAAFIRYHERMLDDRAAVSYLTTMATRIMEMHRALKETGSFYLHCDPTMSHSLKLLCDAIFGRKNLRNEIVWYYKNASRGQKKFACAHDLIFWYSKSVTQWRFNRKDILEPFESGMTAWRYHKKGEPPPAGKTPDDVFVLPSLNAMAKERIGYPTQKPLELIERIIKASSNEGDWVADFFGGCGTTVIAAQKLKRRWIACDISQSAVDVLEGRIQKECKRPPKYEMIGFPVDIKGAERLANDDPIRFQEWVVRCLLGGEMNPKTTADGGYDGHLRIVIGQNEDGEEERGTCLIEVKGGNVTIAMVRAFATVIKNRDAAMGVFVCFQSQVTRGMEREAAAQGSVGDKRIPRLQIKTVEQLLGGDRPRFPMGGLVEGLGE